MSNSFAIVVIGRNEGARLDHCLRSLDGICLLPDDVSGAVGRVSSEVVYVDSGSLDGSPVFAKQHGIDTINLDLPFTAARARNVGFDHVIQRNPSLKYVQFLDGDCEISPNWLQHAFDFLNVTPKCAIVCGVLKERHPDKSIFNRLCQMEWEKTPGEIKASGGVFMIRAEAFRQVNGFTENVVAAEDDELCLRLRQQGWAIHNIDEKMAVHDAAMTQFSQWWRRAHRAGHAYAQGNYLHGKAEYHFSREVRGNWIWGLIVPILAIAFCWWSQGWSLILFLTYPVLAYKVFRCGCRRGWSKNDAALYATFAVLSKFPGVLGMIRFWIRHLLSIQPRIIEHKFAKSIEQ